MSWSPEWPWRGRGPGRSWRSAQYGLGEPTPPAGGISRAARYFADAADGTHCIPPLMLRARVRRLHSTVAQHMAGPRTTSPPPRRRHLFPRTAEYQATLCSRSLAEYPALWHSAAHGQAEIRRVAGYSAPPPRVGAGIPDVCGVPTGGGVQVEEVHLRNAAKIRPVRAPPPGGGFTPSLAWKRESFSPSSDFGRDQGVPPDGGLQRPRPIPMLRGCEAPLSESRNQRGVKSYFPGDTYTHRGWPPRRKKKARYTNHEDHN